MKSKIWSFGLENVGCMPEVFDDQDFVSLCSEIFEPGTHTIRLGGASRTPIMLTHHVFNKILNFPEGGKDLNLCEVDSYLSNHDAVRVLHHFVKDSTLIKRNQVYFNLDILKEPYRDFVWLFLSGSWPRVHHDLSLLCYLCSLHDLLQEYCLLLGVYYCKLSHQLSTFGSNASFLMVAYIVYAIFSTFCFYNFSPTQDLSLYFPVQFHYTQFCKHKFAKNIQLIHDYFLPLVHISLTSKLTGIISSTTGDFL